jgi:hypothetical protein
MIDPDTGRRGGLRQIAVAVPVRDFRATYTARILKIRHWGTNCPCPDSDRDQNVIGQRRTFGARQTKITIKILQGTRAKSMGILP